MIQHAPTCAKTSGLNIQLETCVVALGCTCDFDVRANAALSTLSSNYETAQANWDLTLARAEVAENALAALREENERLRAAAEFVVGDYPTNAVALYRHWTEARSKMRAALAEDGGV